MKYLITIILSLLSLNLYSQDIEFMHYLNVYRKNNEKETFKWSHAMGKISSDQNKINESQDSLSHSGKASEISFMGNSLPSCKETKADFVKFMKDVLKVTYVEPKTNSEVARLVKIYVIYKFHNSPAHKKILLGNYKFVGFDFIIKDINYISNKITIGDKTVELGKFESYYEVKYFFVVNLQK
jgi:hypothetical protein